MDPYTFSLTRGGVGLGVMALSGFAQAAHVGHGHGAHGRSPADDSHARDGHTTHVPAGGARHPGVPAAAGASRLLALLQPTPTTPKR